MRNKKQPTAGRRWKQSYLYHSLLLLWCSYVRNVPAHFGTINNQQQAAGRSRVICTTNAPVMFVRTYVTFPLILIWLNPKRIPKKRPPGAQKKGPPEGSAKRGFGGPSVQYCGNIGLLWPLCTVLWPLCTAKRSQYCRVYIIKLQQLYTSVQFVHKFSKSCH